MNVLGSKDLKNAYKMSTAQYSTTVILSFILNTIFWR